MTEEVKTQLPDYLVERFHMDDENGSYDMLKVECPRCDGEFWVTPGRWLTLFAVKGREGEQLALVFGRSCPYCFKTSAVPEDLRIQPKLGRKIRRRRRDR